MAASPGLAIIWRWSLNTPGMPPSPTLTISINILHCISTFTAITVMALSFQDGGILSLCLNPLFAILTMGYHTTMLLLAFKRPADAPMLSIGYTIAAYLLSLGWLSAYISMAVILSSRQTEFKIFDLWILVPQTVRVPQKIQIMLDPLECVVIGNIAIKSTMERRRWFNESKERKNEGQNLHTVEAALSTQGDTSATR